MKTRQLRLWLCLASAVLGCLWVVLERLVLPGWSAQDGLLACLGFGVLAWVMTSPTFFQKYVGEATAESLGAIRIITCAIVLLMTQTRLDVSSTALLPAEMRHPLGVIQFFYALPGFESFVRSHASLQIFEWVTVLLLFLGIIGWQTRIVLPLGAICFLLLGGIVRHYAWFFHGGLIPNYIMVVLSLTPCGDALSVDRWWKVSRGQAVPTDHPSPVYGWSRYACWVVVALPYVAAGMSKLRNGGFFWWSADNMRAVLYSGSIENPIARDWVLQLTNAPDILFAFLGLAGVYGELAFGLVLFSRLARLVMPIAMAMMHIGILFLQNILFLDLILIQLIFFDFTATRKTISQWIGFKQADISEYATEPLQASELLVVASAEEVHPGFHYQSSNSQSTKPAQASQSPIVFSAKNAYQSFFYPLIISGLVVLLVFCWKNRTEFYPFTGMQMFSRANYTGITGYMKIIAHLDSGETVRVYPDQIIPSAHYRMVARGCFSEESEKVQLCDKFFKTTGSYYNKEIRSGEKMTKFEIQSWRWDFRNNPSDPDYGEVVNRHFVAVNEK